MSARRASADRRGTPTLGGGVVRAAVVPAAVLATVLLPAGGPAVLVPVGLALAGAVAAPALVGALPLLAVEVIAWAAGYGLHGAPASWRTALFVVALYLVQTSTALAAGVGVRARVSVSVVRAWALRCVPPAAAGVLVTVALSIAGRGTGAVGLDVVAFGAVAVIGAALTWLAVTR